MRLINRKKKCKDINAVAGFLGYLGQVDLDWNLIGSFILGASLGSFFGGYLSQFIDGKKLQKYFGYFLIAVATFVLFQNQGAFQKKKTAFIQGDSGDGVMG